MIRRKYSIIFQRSCVNRSQRGSQLVKILSSFLISVFVSAKNWWVNLPETKIANRKPESILIKLHRQNLSLLFNQTFLNERQLPNHTHTHTHTHIYIYIYIVYLGSKSLSKHVQLNNTDCFLFKTFKRRRSSVIGIFLISGSRW